MTRAKFIYFLEEELKHFMFSSNEYTAQTFTLPFSPIYENDCKKEHRHRYRCIFIKSLYIIPLCCYIKADGIMNYFRTKKK